jgi:16S rRNA (guanine(966)-N(2))-methyltransferase RsmD
VRVTGGRLGGRRLAAPAPGVRPTADRVREALFARLGPLDGARVLDLYAGTGALGIEALSRGAHDTVFVERSSASASVLHRNLETLDLVGCSRIVRSEVRGALRRLAREGQRFDLVLADPPYADRDVAASLALLVAGDLLAPGATVVVERSRRHPLPIVEGLVSRDTRRYGDTELEWFEAGPAGAAGAATGPARGQEGPGIPEGSRAGGAPDAMGEPDA